MPPEVIGHYEIEAVAGQGGMGVVYRARDARLGRRVALKVIAPHLAGNPVMRERLNRESTLVASLDHPNIVPLYEAGEADGSLFLASRWVDGDDLAAYVAKETPLSAERAVRLLGQVAGALDAAHAAGLVHRDVKPTNVLVAPDAHAYLTDFGIARRNSDVSGLTATEQLLGTLDYVSPEQIQGETVDARADIYALGGLLYFVLTGEVPFPREGHAAKLYAHLSSPAPSVAAARPDVPAALDAVIAKAMAKNPEDRWQDVDAFRSALFAGLPHRSASRGATEARRRADARPAAALPASSAADLEPLDTIAGRAMAAAGAGPGTGAVRAAPVRPAPTGTRGDDAPEAHTAEDGGAGNHAPQDLAPNQRRRIRRTERSGPSPLVAAAVAAPPEERREPAAPQPPPAEAGGDPPHTRDGSRRRWAGRMLAVGLVLAGLAAAAALYTGLQDEKAGTQTVSLARSAGGIAVAGGRVWVSVPGSSRLVSVPVESIEGRRSTLDVGAPVGALAGRGGHLVVTAGRTLVDLPGADQRRARRTTVPFTPGAVAVGNGSSWVAGASNRRLVRLRGSNAIPTTTSSRIDALATGGGALWVAHAGEGTLGRVEERTTMPTALRRLGGAPTAVAATARAVWVADPERDIVFRLDPRTGKQLGAPIPVPGDPVAIAADSRQVWVARRGDDAVTELDARTGRPLAEVGSAARPIGVALTDDAVWVVGERGQLSRIPR